MTTTELEALWNEVEQAKRAACMVRIRAERGIVAGPDDWKAQALVDHLRWKFDRALAAHRAAQAA